ncbi:unnamed protein product [Linum trigynum]|uniref:MULE transposase domain-containing protein n=1 Tax=Linum trigynum TaxID=586398 RepID=A0AAV2DXH1_9ROSI
MLGEKVIHTIVTDGDKVMQNAIQNVFPHATHRLCAWHLSNNIKSNVKNKPEFVEGWSKFEDGDHMEVEFEEKWRALL